MRKTIVDAIVQKALRNQRRERYDVTDIQQPGLVLRVTENAASWVARSNVGKRNRRITLGPVRQIDLATARRITQAVHDTLRSGRDVDDAWLDMRLVEAGIRAPHPEPEAPEPVEDSAAPTWTWEEALDAYSKEMQRTLRDKSYKSYRSVLTGPHLRVLAGRLVAEITRADIAKISRDVHATGTERAAETIVTSVRPMWAFLELDAHRKDSGVTIGEMRDLRYPRRSKDKVSKTLTPLPEIDQVGRLVAICRAGILEASYASALELLAFTVQRRLTIASAHVSNFDLGQPQPVWVVDAELIKGKLEHMVPLLPRSVEIVKEALERKAGETPWLFPQLRPGRGQKSETMSHISEENLSHKVLDLPDTAVTLHGIRRAFTTAIKRRRRGSVREPRLILDHLEGRTTVTDESYDRHDYLEEKVDMLEFWSELVEAAAQKAADDLDHAPIRNGLLQATRKRNRKRIANRQAQAQEVKASAIAARAPDDRMDVIDIIDEWAAGRLSNLDAKAMANVESVNDLRELAIDFGIDIRRR